MSDWSAGYVSDIGYTFGYYNELNPLRARLALLNAGLACPEFTTGCELGFGQGLSANFHAAASAVQWHGTDFNPAQAGFAQELAAASGSGARLYDEAFADFASRSDLPDFDFIGLHGIWSWISDENRSVIAQFVRRKLKVGGVLYVSYNTLPGWGAFAPMRHLMSQHAEVIGAEGHGIVSRINGALEFAEKLLDTNPAYGRANPQIAERIKKIKDQNRHYLAHEYFNRDWQPMHFATMASCLEPAKVNYACSAVYLDHIDPLNLTPEQQSFLKDIPDAMFRESTRDFMVNQQFRRDYWIKGARKLSPLDQAEALRAQKVVLMAPRPDVSLKVSGALGEASMSEAIYHPILDYLADHKTKSIGQIEQATQAQGLNLGLVKQAVLLLAGIGHLGLVQDESVTARSRKHTDKLNAHLMAKARSNTDVGHLASPVTGGGIPVGRFNQLFLMALAQGKKQPADWAQFVWSVLAMQGQHLIKDGQALQTPAENLAELNSQATLFGEKHLPILRALQIV
ncbi:class I SAM-dependent methyltransferase [Ramlibacter sp.]|uniref:class I SAM-dependent methyltransferase n=1 Tax=Ramlibacter sp. TaxID=1917967 RepID=UPI002C9D11C8|nr:class I SAM-dependent methyltransferase [Ramlibacter sp.]HWI84502.1 class I SAM-dependent methyltransferase [Ramlibacter sp.]